CLAAAVPAAPPLRAMRWLAPGADVARALSRRPVECLKPPRDAERAYKVELGRATLRTPLLLGGQAARAGIACETCHRNGRANADFDFPGLSGAAGTADVTASLFSSHRGDGVFNPVPIPDLGGPKAGLKISQAPGSPALEHFIHGLITEEFDAAEPPPAVLAGLAAYVRALTPAACRLSAREPVRAQAAVGEVRRAVRAALAALAHGDFAAAAVMVQSARSQLGAVAERYAGADLAPERLEIGGADLDLAAALASVRGRDRTASVRLEAWLARSAGWAGALRRREGRSLYNPVALAGISKMDSETARAAADRRLRPGA
ncbi:MAG: hypothetical protein ACR2FH_00375, partial [Caulobacteraceae bacterium]